MGIALTDADEYVHPVGAASNWNESRYIDFWDRSAGIGGWFRIGNRPNEGRAEMSACINLPDATTAFFFCRAPITSNELVAGGQRWEVVAPWDTTKVVYRGEMLMLDDAWTLADPKTAYTNSPRADAQIE